MITLGGVQAREMWEGLRKWRADNGPYVDLSYLVDYDQADTFMDAVMGGIITHGKTWETVPRLKCPTNPKLYAKTVDYVGAAQDHAGSAGGRPKFRSAVVSVHFEVPDWPMFPSDDPGGQQSFPLDDNQPILMAECSIDFASEFQTVPKGTYVFTSDQRPTNFDLGRWGAVSTWRIVRQYFPLLPYTKIMAKVGKLNNTKFLGLDRGLVRFANSRCHQTKSTEGVRTQQWELVFEAKTRDWNQFLRDDDAAWDDVSAPSDSTKQPYEYTDLSPLLRDTVTP